MHAYGLYRCRDVMSNIVHDDHRVNTTQQNNPVSPIRRNRVNKNVIIYGIFQRKEKLFS